jgi:hypothetical protein
MLIMNIRENYYYENNKRQRTSERLLNRIRSPEGLTNFVDLARPVPDKGTAGGKASIVNERIRPENGLFQRRFCKKKQRTTSFNSSLGIY